MVIMLSSITKMKNFSLLTSQIFKTELLLFVNCQKNFSTSKVRLSNYSTENDFVHMHKHINSAKVPKDFGKIVCLDPENLEIENESNISEFKSPKKKKLKKAQKTKIVNGKSEKVQMVNKSSKDEEFIQNSEKNKGVKEENYFFDENEINSLSEEFKNLKSRIITNQTDLLRKYMTTLKSKNRRMEENKIIIEGKRLIHDALSAGCIPKIIFFSRLTDIQNLNLPEKVKLIRTPYKDLQFWSNTVTSQGVIGVFKMPNLENKKEDPESVPLTIICNNVRDPGNMGSILRVAAGVGCRKIILTKGCVDIWEPKILRAAAGAHFRLPCLKNLEWSDIENEIKDESKVVLADSKHPFPDDEEDKKRKKSVLFKTESKISNDIQLLSYESVDYGQGNVVVVVGGETFGLSEEAFLFAMKRKSVRVFIPVANQVESLNNAVALGILSYEIKRQLTKPSVDKSDTERIATSVSHVTETTDNNNLQSHQATAFSVSSDSVYVDDKPQIDSATFSETHDSTDSNLQPQTTTISAETVYTDSKPQVVYASVSQSHIKDSTDNNPQPLTTTFPESIGNQNTDNKSESQIVSFSRDPFLNF